MSKPKVSDPHMDTQSARKELATNENQRLLRQFMKNPEGEKNSTAYREGWERTFGGSKAMPTCEHCDGRGKVMDGTSMQYELCTVCGGTGSIDA